jgi:hypothetical protein
METGKKKGEEKGRRSLQGALEAAFATQALITVLRGCRRRVEKLK